MTTAGLAISLWSKRNGSFGPSVSELLYAIKKTVPIGAAVCQKLAVFRKKTNHKIKLGGWRRRQERVHFYFDRIGLDSKLLTDQSAFEVTFSVSKNSTTAYRKPDVERVMKE